MHSGSCKQKTAEERLQQLLEQETDNEKVDFNCKNNFQEVNANSLVLTTKYFIIQKGKRI